MDNSERQHTFCQFGSPKQFLASQRRGNHVDGRGGTGSPGSRGNRFPATGDGGTGSSGNTNRLLKYLIQLGFAQSATLGFFCAVAMCRKGPRDVWDTPPILSSEGRLYRDFFREILRTHLRSCSLKGATTANFYVRTGAVSASIFRRFWWLFGVLGYLGAILGPRLDFKQKKDTENLQKVTLLGFIFRHFSGLFFEACFWTALDLKRVPNGLQIGCWRKCQSSSMMIDIFRKSEKRMKKYIQSILTRNWTKYNRLSLEMLLWWNISEIYMQNKYNV